MANPDRDFGHLESSDGRMAGYVDRFGVERDMSGAAIVPGSRVVGAMGAPVIGAMARGVAVLLAQSATPASVTGTTSETVLATIAIPAGAMGVNGSLRVRALWSANATVGTWQPTIRFDGIVMQQPAAIANTGKEYWSEWFIFNRGVANSQIRINTQPPNNSSTSAPQTSAIDTSVSKNLTFTGTLTNTGDTMTLEAVIVESLNP